MRTINSTRALSCIALSAAALLGAQTASAHAGYDMVTGEPTQIQILAASDPASQIPWQLLEELKLAEKGLAEISSGQPQEKDSHNDDHGEP